MTRNLEALTDKEKEALRLLLVGHDAKSMAGALGLSVHTVNDRLRHARRKLSVASSKQAARLLHDWETAAKETPAPPLPPVPDPAPPTGPPASAPASGTDPHRKSAPQSLVPKPMGDAPASEAVPDGKPRAEGAAVPRPVPLVAGGIAMITIAAALLAMSAQAPDTPASPTPAAAPSPTESAQPAAAADAARQWLRLVDAGDWRASYDATAGSFRAVNTLDLWTSVSQDVRVPLGAVTSREALSEESIPGGPRGLRLVRFRTSFANKPAATETLSLAREDGAWKVGGYYIE